MGVRTAAAVVPRQDEFIGQKPARKLQGRPRMIEFFAGSGLVECGLGGMFETVWANDICTKKANVYTANHGPEVFHLGDIQDIDGSGIPAAHLSWASFPCQDLSLAGLTSGIEAERSGLVWQWLRILDGMPVRPKVLVAENVVGLVSTAGGKNYRQLHLALQERGYRVGAVLLNAKHFVPQSRPRIFVVAIADDIDIPEDLIDNSPNWLHNDAIIRVSKGLPGWVWWRMPHPMPRRISLASIIEWDAPADSAAVTERNLSMMPEAHRNKLLAASDDDTVVATGYKRTRMGKQVLEVRFDGIAGCLRTPEGGSSRQMLIMKRGGTISTRLLTVRETARLMGASEDFVIPGGYNDGYKAMGDAVAAPVAEYLGRQLLLQLTEAAYE
ncbi:MAG: DNA cytosine methyltransferase [Negativicutes bacterium]